ncbi:alpha/beta fold hydrolase [Brachybacterium halotolerans]|uniref:alpha/beta fold hydrolase n=1 Tax=Brachybacterium halotolerans TaxID=2795215 RepID=UPI0031B6217A
MTVQPHLVRRGSGTPVLFVHGNGLDHRLLLDLDDVFAADGAWERLYPDLPGFGGTPPLEGRGGLPDLADRLDEIVGELLGTRPFAVVANSLGGLLARDLVARRSGQCLGMALLAPVVDPVREHRTLPARTVLAEEPGLLASLDPADAETYAEMAVVLSRENWERFRESALPGVRGADVEAMRRLGDLYELGSLPDAALAADPSIRDLPVLVVTGRQDDVVGYEDQDALARRFPRATFAALDGAGHNVHLDQPDAVRALLRAWLTAVRRGAEERSAAEERGGAPTRSTPAPGRVELRGTLVCADDQEADLVRRHLARHVELTRAEPGCLAFHVEPTEDPLVWTVAETFVDRESFAAHQARVAASAWGQATERIRRDYRVSGASEDPPQPPAGGPTSP